MADPLGWRGDVAEQTEWFSAAPAPPWVALRAASPALGFLAALLLAGTGTFLALIGKTVVAAVLGVCCLGLIVGLVAANRHESTSLAARLGGRQRWAVDATGLQFLSRDGRSWGRTDLVGARARPSGTRLVLRGPRPGVIVIPGRAFRDEAHRRAFRRALEARCEGRVPRPPRLSVRAPAEVQAMRRMLRVASPLHSSRRTWQVLGLAATLGALAAVGLTMAAFADDKRTFGESPPVGEYAIPALAGMAVLGLVCAGLGLLMLRLARDGQYMLLEHPLAAGATQCDATPGGLWLAGPMMESRWTASDFIRHGATQDGFWAQLKTAHGGPLFLLVPTAAPNGATLAGQFDAKPSPR